MSVMRVCAAIFVGACVGAIGVVLSPGPLGLPWLGVGLAIAVVAMGSFVAETLAHASGVLAYSLAVFGVTLWFMSFSQSNDVLTLPEALGGSSVAQLWPLLSMVCAMLPGFLLFRWAEARDASSVGDGSEYEDNMGVAESGSSVLESDHL